MVTESLLFLGELDAEAMGDALADATHYEPTPVADFEALLETIPEPLNDFTFVDIGAGMGRVILLASQHPFKQVVGIELSPALCEVARDNVVRWMRGERSPLCRDVRIVCGDAAAAKLPPGPLIVYLFNPFGERTLYALARRIGAETRGPAYVLYHTPVARHVFDEDPRFGIVAETACGLTYRTA